VINVGFVAINNYQTFKSKWRSIQIALVGVYAPISAPHLFEKYDCISCVEAFDEDRALICISSLGVHIGFVFGLYNAKLNYIGEYELGYVVSWKLWLRGSLLSKVHVYS
jgi:hypothetical protein